MEACSSHGDRAGGVKRNHTAISVELKQAVCEYAQKHPVESQIAVATWFSQRYNIHPPVQRYRSTIGKILERKDEFLEIDENHPSLKRAILTGTPNGRFFDSVLIQRLQQVHEFQFHPISISLYAPLTAILVSTLHAVSYQ